MLQGCEDLLVYGPAGYKVNVIDRVPLSDSVNSRFCLLVICVTVIEAVKYRGVRCRQGDPEACRLDLRYEYAHPGVLLECLDGRSSLCCGDAAVNEPV